MADSNYRPTGELNDLANEDPFAELTRIMGHDPRVARSPLKPVASETQDSLALELESELMSGLDAEEAGAAPEAEVALWQRELKPMEASASSEPEFDNALDAMLDDVFAASAEKPETLADAEQPEAALEPEQFETLAEADQPETHVEEDAPQDFDLRENDLATLDSDFRSEEPGPDVPAEMGSQAESAPVTYAEYEGGEPVSAAFEADDVPSAVTSQTYSELRSEEVEPESSASSFHLEGGVSISQVHAEDSAGAEIPFDYVRASSTRPAFLSEAGHDIEEPQTQESWAAVPAWQQGLAAEEEPSAEAEPSTNGPEAEIVSGAAHEDREWEFRDAVGDPETPPSVMAPVVAHMSASQPPEVETVEVPEGPVALAEALDIPDVSYHEQVKPAAELDEIEEILAGAFGEIVDQTDPAGDVWSETSAPEKEQEQASREADDFLADFAGTDAFAVPSQETPYTDEWKSAAVSEPSLTPAPGVEPPLKSRDPRRSSRFLAAAAVLGGVVALGGVAVFAFSGSEGGGEPVLVSADKTPVKVKPENPGGIEIPNQDNQVYKRASGEAADTQPQQPHLISAAEEPVKLDPPDEPRASVAVSEPRVSAAVSEPEPEPSLPTAEEQIALAPSAETEVPDIIPAEGVQQDVPPLPPLVEGEESVALAPPPVDATEPATPAPVKTDERLANPIADNSAADEDIISLTPRRVRSLVVLPDGTMVPREAPEPAPETATPAGEEIAALPGVEIPGQEVEANARPADVAGTQTPSVPRTGPIPPSRPGNIAPAGEQQPSEPAPQQPRQQEPREVAALNPQAAQSSLAASEWSVQIASQPTAEAAQQSYQQLAQRYGSMLEGKGVNIVKADIAGKGTYYRVRIPSTSKEEAIRLCEDLKSAGASCFVSK